jgi:hypothetical protein
MALASSRGSAGVRDGSSRAAGGWGWAFVVLLLVSAGMASVPGGDDATSTVRDFYTRHTSVIVTAQVIGLLAAAAFVPFALTLRSRAAGQRHGLGGLEAAGLAVPGASLLTTVPVLWLCAVADSASSSLAHRLAVASDLTDVVQFAAIAAFGAMLASASTVAWFKVVAAVVAVLALARAVELVVGSQLLELVAPMAFVALVVLVSTLVLLRRSPVSPR